MRLTDDEGSADALLSVGEMARLNYTTERALRLYQKKGLLEPSAVDPQTGYRFYAKEQSVQLDEIQYYKSLGFSLEEIRRIMDDYRSPAAMTMFMRRHEEVVREIDALMAVQHELASALLDYGEWGRRPLGKPTIEWMPARRYLFWPIDPPIPYEDVDDATFGAWNDALRAMRRDMLDKGVPQVLLHNASAFVSCERLEHGPLALDGMAMFLGDKASAHLASVDVRATRPGFVVSLLTDGFVDERGGGAEPRDIRRMLEYAADNGWRVCGDYIGEGSTDSVREGRRLKHLRLPVSLGDEDA